MRFPAAVWLIVSLAIAPSAATAGDIRTVMLSGHSAPGVPQSAFAGLRDPASPPVINAAGRTAFFGMLSAAGDVTAANDLGQWSEGLGALTLVAREGSQAPGEPPGVKFSTLFALRLNARGQTAFRSALLAGVGDVTTANDSTIWSEGHGALAVVAREGRQAPGAPAGEIFRPLGDMVFNDNGETAFHATYHAPSNPAGPIIDGIWAERNGAVALVARQGDPAPGIPGVVFEAFSSPIFNNRSQTAFIAHFKRNVGSVNDNNDTAIATEGSGVLTLIGREGDPQPGGGTYFNLDFPLMDAAGKTLIVTGEAIFARQAGATTTVVRVGDPAPGVPNGYYAGFDSQDHQLNRHGQLAIQAVLDKSFGPGITAANDRGLWSQGLGGWHLVAREGNPAPGTPNANFSSVTDVVINAAGQTAFSASLVPGPGGVIPLNSSGLWAEDSAGVLRLIARTGDVLSVGPGDARTISALVFQGDSGNEDGRPSGFNDAGQVAFGAVFTDGTSGVFVSNLVSTLPRFAADFNADGAVDAADLAAWRLSASVNASTDAYADADGDGDSDGADFVLWQRQLGSGVNAPGAAAVPEPASPTLALLLCLAASPKIARRRA